MVYENPGDPPERTLLQLTLSVTISTFAERMLFFLVFGLGFGMPLFVLSLLAPAQQSWLLRQFTRHYAVATRLAGVLLIVVGLPTSSQTSRRSVSTSRKKGDDVVAA